MLVDVRCRTDALLAAVVSDDPKAGSLPSAPRPSSVGTRTSSLTGEAKADVKNSASVRTARSQVD